MSEYVTFKGNRDGIVMVLDNAIPFEELCEQIIQKLWQSRDFLGDHMTLSIHTNDHPFNAAERLALKILMQSLGNRVLHITPEEYDSCTEEQVKAFTESPVESTQNVTPGVIPDLPKQPEPKVHKKLKRSTQSRATEEILSAPTLMTSDMGNLEAVKNYLVEGSLVIRKNIRSGQRIVFDGTLIVIGDVNPGAELIASGHIFVLGKMRGMAHAGYLGNKNAIVCSTNLIPLQLRIADIIARAPEQEHAVSCIAELAYIGDNQMMIDAVE